MIGKAMTIREIIERLHDYDKQPVRFGFGGCWPMDIISYRGWYSCPAIQHSDGRYNNAVRPPTATELRDRLRWAVECGEYEAWKGGKYTYGYNDVLFVANEGIHHGATVITGVRYDGAYVILVTAYYPEIYELLED